MIKTLKTIFCIIAISLAGYFAACKKADQPADFIDTKATISFTGNVASDGCGYFVVINGTSYHADNLSDDYATDKLNVVVSAKITSAKYQCGLVSGNLFPVIHIIAISK